MRPFGPLPVIWSSAIPWSTAIRRASGVAKIRAFFSGAASVPAGFSFRVSERISGSLPAKAADEYCGNVLVADWVASSPCVGIIAAKATESIDSPSSASTAITVPTATFCVPASTSIFATTPSSMASTSMVALSVSISAIISPAFTSSPIAIVHLATEPDVMVGDRAGMVTFTDMVYPLNPSHTACAVATISSTCGNANFSKFSA